MKTKFWISRTSQGCSDEIAPCPGCKREIEYSGKTIDGTPYDSWGWTIEMDWMDLYNFSKEYGYLVYCTHPDGTSTLEIYDDYRE